MGIWVVPTFWLLAMMPLGLCCAFWPAPSELSPTSGAFPTIWEGEPTSVFKAHKCFPLLLLAAGRGWGPQLGSPDHWIGTCDTEFIPGAVVGVVTSFSQRQWGQCSGSHAHTGPWIGRVGDSAVVPAPGISGFHNRFAAFMSLCVLLGALSTNSFSAHISQSQLLLLPTKNPKWIALYDEVLPYMLTRRANWGVFYPD